MAGLADWLLSVAQKMERIENAALLRQLQEDGVKLYAACYLERHQGRYDGRTLVDATYQWLAESTDGIPRRKWRRWTVENLEARYETMARLLQEHDTGQDTELDRWLDRGRDRQ